MAHTSKIEWTEATWNPWHGCHKVSAGCKNCYMFRDKAKYGQDPNVVVRSKTRFYDPLKWTEPRTIFTCSWSDFFIEEADPWRDEAFAIMALTPQHTYQVLTKRPERMREYLGPGRQNEVVKAVVKYLEARGSNAWRWIAEYDGEWPPKNVWLGVSVEDQETADERIQALLKTPAAVRWLSIEPLLGPVDLTRVKQRLRGESYEIYDAFHRRDSLNKGYPWPGIDWVVVGGESGPNARPMHPDWARSLRDQCTAAGVPFFFKQWGEWLPFEETAQPPFYRNCATGVEHDAHGMNFIGDDGFEPGEFMGAKWMDPHDAIAYNDDEWDCSYLRVGKKAAGRLLDGRTWDELPEVSNG